MNRFLTVIATGLTVLPIVAFAQGTVAPASTPAPAATTQAPAVKAPDTAMKAAPATTAKSDVKTPVAPKKSEVHGMNSVTTHHAAVKAPVAAGSVKG